MNKNYRVVWNDTLGTWVVASELAKGKTKASTTKSVVMAAAIAISLSTGGAWAFTSDVDGKISDEVVEAGTQNVNAGGETYNVTVGKSGIQNINNGGYAFRTLLSRSGVANENNPIVNINSGGHADELSAAHYGSSVRVNDGGLLTNSNLTSGVITAYEGGKVNNLTIDGDSRWTAFNANLNSIVTNTTINKGLFRVYGHTTGTISNGGTTRILNGGEDHGATINNRGWIVVWGGGKAYGATVNTGGELYVASNTVSGNQVRGEAHNTIVDGGLLYLGGQENSDGNNSLNPYGNAYNTTITNGGRLVLRAGKSTTTGSIAENTNVINGTLDARNHAIIKGVTTIHEGGKFLITNRVVLEDTATVIGEYTDSASSSIQNNGQFIFNQDKNQFEATTVAAQILGNGSFHQKGNNTIILTGDNSYLGGTYIDSGVVGGTISYDSTIYVGKKGKLLLDQDTDIIISGNIQGTGYLEKTGTGILTIKDLNNSFTGNWSINAGTLTGGAGALQGNINNESTVQFADDGNTKSTFKGSMTGAGKLEKVGTGTSIIDDSSTLSHTGGTSIVAGALQGNANSFEGKIDVGANGKLIFDQTSKKGKLDHEITGKGTIGTTGTGTLEVAKVIKAKDFEHGGGVLSIIDGGKFQLTGKLTVVGGAQLNVHENATPVEALSAALKDGAIINLVTATNDPTKTYVLITTTDGITANLDDVTLKMDGQTVTSKVTLDSHFTGNFGLANGNKDLVFGGTVLVWDHSDTAQAHGTFNIGINNTETIENKLTQKSVTTNKWNWDGRTLTKTGEGTLVLTGDNSAQLVMDVQKGTLSGSAKSIKGDVQLADQTKIIFDQDANGTYSGKVTVATGGHAEFIKKGDKVLTLTGVNEANISVEAGSIKGTTNSIKGNVALANADSSVNFSQNTNGTYSKNISGAGKLVKSGTGELTLAGINTHKGGTDVNAGQLNSSVANLGTGAIAVNDNATLAINEATAATLGNKLSGKGTLEKAGIGKLTVNNVESIGGINVKEGGLALNHTGTLTLANNLELANNTALDIKVGSDASIAADKVNLGGNVTLNLDKVADTAGVLNDKFETQVLISSNGITGDIANVTVQGQSIDDAITADTYLTAKVGKDGNNIVSTLGLVWNNASAKAHGAFKIDDNTTFTVTSNLADRSGEAFTGWDGKTLTKSGKGILALEGTNAGIDYSVTEGTLLGNKDSLQGSIDIAANAKTVFDGAGVQNESKVISGDGTLEKTGAGELALTANNSVKNISVKGGALKGNTASIQGNVAVAKDTKVTFNQGSNGTFAKVIFGDGQLVKSGAGELTLTGKNTHKGGTSITAGQLTADKGALGAGAISVNNSGSLQLTGAGAIGNAIAGTGNLVKAGSDDITLSKLGDIGSITVTEGGLYIHQNTTVNVTNSVDVGNGATLSVDMDAKPSIIADKVKFGTGATLDITNFANDDEGTGLNIIETKNGVTGDYIATAGGQLVGSTVDIDSFVVGGVRTEGNNIVARTSMVWDYNKATEAHGTFNISTEATISSDLVDRSDVDASTNDWGWDGKSLTKSGAGTLTLAGNNSYTGGTAVQAGTLKGDTNSLKGDINVAQDANLVFNQTANGKHTGALSGDGNLVKQGSGDLTLGKNGIQNIAVEAGKLIGNASNIAGTVKVNKDATLVLNQTTNGVFAGSVTGKDAANKGTFEKRGAGQLTLDNAASVDTNITLTAGSIKGKAGSIKGDVATATGSTLELTEGAFAKSITGSGQLAKSGVDKLSLTGTKAETVDVNLTGGTLEGHTGNLTGLINTGAGTTLTFNQLTDGAFNAAITGAGKVEKTGAAKLNVESNSTLDNLTVAQGTVSIAKDTVLNITNDLNVGGNGVLDINYGTAPSVTAGTVDFAAGSTLNIDKISFEYPTDQVLISTTGGITGGNNYNVTVAGTALNTDITSTDDYSYGTVSTVGNNVTANVGLAWNHASTSHGTFNIDPEAKSFTLDLNLTDNANTASHKFGWNGKGLTKEGAGTLILNGQNRYSGATFANNGQLIIGGDASKSTASIRSDVTVANNALLGGHGSIFGQVSVKSGGVISPGTSIGTLSAGSVHFESGSGLVIEGDANGMDKLVVSSSLNGDGKVTIDTGANLAINALAGVWQPAQSYVIVTADGGVSGEFTNVTKDTVFLNHDVVYNAKDIVLNVTRNNISFGSVGNTYNQRQVANNVEALGQYNPIYGQIVGMGEDDARSAFDMLSGEIHASAKAALLNNAQFSRNAIYNHLAGNAPSSIENGRELWINFWGQKGSLDGNANAAKLKNEGWGFLVGSDLFSNDQVRFGVALGYEQNDLKVNDRNSKAESEGVHLMAYGQAFIDQFELSGGIGYNWQKLDTKRNVSVGNLYSQNNAKYDANVFQIFMKGQYNIEVDNSLTVSPYLALAYQNLKTDNFRENGSDTNLVSAGKSNDLWTTSLGINAKYKIADQGEVFADLAWKHNSKKNYSANMRFDSGSASYKVNGVNLSKDTGVVGLGGTYNFSQATKVSFGYEGEFGNKTKNNSFKLQFQHTF